MRIPYVGNENVLGSMMPRLSLTLMYGRRSVEVIGLVDSGAAINLIPYQVGAALGADWDELPVTLELVGNLGKFEAKPLFVKVSHPDLTGSQPVELTFAWTRAENAPILLGQMDFFLEFDVCFYRSESIFQIERRAKSE